VTLLLPDLVAGLAGVFPDGVAWRNVADGRELTLGDWHRLSNRLARGLRRHGLDRGDRVGLLIGNEEPLEWLVSYLAIHKAGGVAVPLLARLGPGELVRILHDAGASFVLCSEVVDAVRTAVPTVACTGPTDGLRWVDLLSPDDRDLEPAFDADDVADIMYTSGTTGRPKGVLVRHGGLSSTDHVPSSWSGLGFLSSSPFATTSGSLLVAGPLRGGLSGFFLPRFSADDWVASVERDRPVAAFLVPAMVELIVASSRFAGADLSSLAAVTIGSAPVAAATLRRFGAGLPATALAPGDVGEVTIGGARPVRSYLGDGERADDTWLDGWLRSGDLGYLDAEGHLWIVGRAKELIIRGGHNVAPGEVEAALFEHPGVVEAAVSGVPHPVLGEDVAAWVVLGDDTSVDELRAFLLERLADYKVPRRITVVEVLPRNESGKVLKSLLEVESE